MDTNSKKRRVLLVNNSVYLPGEGGYKRTMYMLDMMKRAGYPVTLITGDFNHYQKQARDVNAFRSEHPDYPEIEFLHMPAYRKNISVKRYLSEKAWSRRFAKWFRSNCGRFDVVFFSDTDYILPVAKLCRERGIRMIIDIRDLRPEAFRVIVRNELLYRIIFFPMKCRADKAFAYADELIAVSQEYLDRGLSVNKRAKDPVVVYLGSTLERFYDGVARYSGEIEKPDGEYWICYAGTLGESYDLATVIRAAKLLQDMGMTQIRFKILGQGPDEEKLKKQKESSCAELVDFVGFLPYERMAAFLSKSDAAINAVKKSASQSIINKVADYLAAGIPMLNGCTCKEQIDMVRDREVGLNYESEDPDDLVRCIMELFSDPERSARMGENAKRLALERFDRRTSYLEILKRIDTV